MGSQQVLRRGLQLNVLTARMTDLLEFLLLNPCASARTKGMRAAKLRNTET